MSLNINNLPQMRCDNGCGDCCGPAPCYDEELANIKNYIKQKGIIPKDQGLTCPLYINGECSVYPVRPFICKLFGHSPTMVCSRGYNVNIKAKDEKRLMAEHKAKFKNGVYGMRMTHEVLEDGLCRVNEELGKELVKVK